MSSNSKKKKRHNAIQPTNAAEERRAVRNPKTGRKKTSIACQHCWKSKTRCGIKRPCDRCVRLGHQDCHDRPEATRKRQHINKTKKESTSNNSTTHAIQAISAPVGVTIPPIPNYTFSPISGYIASSDTGNQFPPMLSTATSFIAAANTLITPNINMMPGAMMPPPPLPPITLNMVNHNGSGSSSDTTCTVFPSVLDPNFGANTVQNLKISDVMLDGAQKPRESSKKPREKKKKSKRKKGKKHHKKHKHKRKKRKEIATGDEPPLKKRKKNFRDDDSVFGARPTDGHEADTDGCAKDEEIMSWDQPHKEIDPFSDSSHYSTEYSEDEDDPSLAVIISICRDTDKTPVQFNTMQPVQFKNKTKPKQPQERTPPQIQAPQRDKKGKSEDVNVPNRDSTEDRIGEVWSHYTFTRGHLSKFISVDESKQSRIPFTKMVSAPSSPSENKFKYRHVTKKESTIDQDLAAIIAPVGMLMNHREKATVDIRKRCPPLPIFKAIPMNNLFTPHRDVLCQTIPNWTMPPIPALRPLSSTVSASSTNSGPQSNNSVFPSFSLAANRLNAVNVQSVCNALSSMPGGGPFAPTIARITPLIPAPATNMSIN